jgi:hypothetical protein
MPQAHADVRAGASGTGTTSAAVAVTATEPVKRRATYYTPERVAAARRNIANFAWARQIRDTAVAHADRIVAQGDEWLWSLVPAQTLPRSINVNYVLGSPVTGKDVYQLGFYPFRIDQWNQPWKIVDPLAQQRGLPYIFPTNDFEAFYRSALDEHGVFDPARGDRSLLVNELYPEMGPDWGVDDGYGWVDDDGNRWTFIAYYCHYGLWFTGVSTIGAVALIGAGAWTFGGLQVLRDAYLYTGDPKYAHAGIVLLDRIADLYPAMDVGAYPTDFRNNDPGTKKGKILGSIWETSMALDLVTSYDAYFPALADGDAAGVVPFLAAKAEKFGLAPKDSVEAIRLNIENGILRQIYPAVRNAQIYGNFGTHQSALALAGVVLDHPDEAREWIDFVFASGGIRSEPEWHVTGGNVYSTLVDIVDRDGWGNEAAPQYNTIWFDNLKTVADVLDGYEGYPGADLYTHPKFRRMFTSGPRIVALNRYMPNIGDSGGCGQPVLWLNKANYVKGFEEYGDPLLAQIAYLLNGNRTTGLNTGIFSDDPAGTERAIQQVIDERGPLDLRSDNLTGYGLAFLRDGIGSAKREAWIYYGRSMVPHGSRDILNLGLYAFGLDLAPDHGYPEATDYTNFSAEWTKNTISHNTVVVDASAQAGAFADYQWVATPHGFASGDRVQVVDIAAPQAYPQTDLYRRVTVMIRADEENSYLVDIFRVVGGSDHVYSFHAAEGPASVDGLTLVDQPTGTYAGPDVPMPERRATPTRWEWGGFDWLDHVARDTNPRAPFSIDWDITDTWNAVDPDPDAHVRLTVLSDVDDVALANGYPPQNNPRNPRSLRYALLHRSGSDGLASQFVSVIEPYVGTRFVSAIESVRVKPPAGTVAPHEVAAIKVTLKDGRTDYVVSSLRPDVPLRIDDRFTVKGSFVVYSLRDGEPEYALTHGTSVLEPVPGLRPARAEVTGTLLEFTTELAVENELVVAVDGPMPKPAELVGGYVYVANDGERNAAYRIVSAKAEGRSRLVLDIGDQTTVRSYVDANDFSKGFRYDVAKGARVRIPLTREWRRP